MKKISYYVAAFALCCGISQTLTSCIEETEEPDDVKALRQAEIAKINAEAEVQKATALSTEADATLTKAEATYKEAEAAVKLVDKAVAEGASAEAIQAKIAEYKATIQKETAAMNKDAKTASADFLPAALNTACGDAYTNFVAAEKSYLGYDNSGTWVKGTVEKLAEAIADTLDADALLDKKQTILDLQQQILADKKSVEVLEKGLADWKKDYTDGNSVVRPDEYDMTVFSGTFDKTDDNASTLYDKGISVWNYQINSQKAVNQKNIDKLAAIIANSAETDNGAWFSSDPYAPGKYNDYLKAVKENDQAKANYEKTKAIYDETYAAVKAAANN